MELGSHIKEHRKLGLSQDDLAERMKKQHDLVTYREVLAFSRGERVERDTLEGHREREMNPWVKGMRNSVRIILGALAGGLIGVGIGMLAKMLS